MTSLGLNVSVLSITLLSVPTLFPRSTEVTETEDAGGDPIEVVSADFFAHEPTIKGRAAMRNMARGHRGCLNMIATSFRGFRLRIQTSVDSGGRELEHLTGLDQIGIFDLVPVRLEDLPPLAGVAVDTLGDLRETVALLHDVRPGRGRGARGVP